MGREILRFTQDDRAVLPAALWSSRAHRRLRLMRIGADKSAMCTINRHLHFPQNLADAPVRRFSMITFHRNGVPNLFPVRKTKCRVRIYPARGALLLSCLVILPLGLVACGGTNATHKA